MSDEGDRKPDVEEAVAKLHDEHVSECADGRKKYSDKFRALAVYLDEELEMSTRAVGRELGVPESTLRKWKQTDRPTRRHIEDEVERLHETVDDELLVISQSLLYDAAGVMMDESNRDEASYRDGAVAFGILHDKMQTLRGKPTQITENRQVEDARSRIANSVRERAEDAEFEEVDE